MAKKRKNSKKVGTAKVRRIRLSGGGGRKGRGAKGRTARAGAAGERASKRVRDAFPSTRRSGGGSGFGVLVAVVEGVGGAWDVAQVIDDQTVGRGGAAKDGGAVGGLEGTARGARAIAKKSRVRRLSSTLAALGHPSRVMMLVKLLEGPATYRALQKMTGLKPGPLYHHISQLRLAGLLRPKQRDLYAMTRAGRNVLLVSLALMSLAKDLRERPAPKV